MVKTDSYVQFEAGKLTYRVVPVTEEIIRMIVSGKEIKAYFDQGEMRKVDVIANVLVVFLRLIFQQRKMQEVSL